MTEPRVEAGDRALETARKFTDEVFTEHNPTLVANWTTRLAALIQSAMNAHDKERLGTDWQELAEKNQETARKALALVDAMNAQVRELREALRKMLTYVERRGDAEKFLAVGKAERLLAERGEGR